MRSPTIGKLAKALAKAQAEIGAAERSGTNPAFKSSYATLADVWAACREQLAANGLSVVQLPGSYGDESGAAVSVTTLLMHESDEWIESTLDIPYDGSRNTAHAIGSAITYARRYALGAVAGVAPDDDDGNAVGQGKAPSQKKASKPAKPSRPQDPRTPLRAEFSKRYTQLTRLAEEVNEPDMEKQVRAALDKIVGGTWDRDKATKEDYVKALSWYAKKIAELEFCQAEDNGEVSAAE